MSPDLELRQDLPVIQVRPATTKIETLQSCSAADDKKAIIQQENSETDDCQTPKSEEHRIPAVLSCPPAPRKAKRIVSCKRKLREIDFFEIVNREEVDSFFQSSSELLTKRSRICTA
ncbi:hypothetical protein SADUNF_Sadunf10G0179800 [Salix dunnii]|uniref:Cyclin-dependent protein kinase inhibitor SMR1 n=1 Tax=Salix dunnii TaxID=1413687 RepID=A0A835JV44_9ROSI|nr:hypothetical protein SADUNF_Sadunf10G0179800 [Salix dunnii]